MEKQLGKIKKVTFGYGGYQDVMLGIHFHFSFDGSGIYDTKSFWDFNLIKHTENCKWSEEDREKQVVEVMKYISDLLRDAKVDDINKLVGVPVEITLDDMTLLSWRILTEVL